MKQEYVLEQEKIEMTEKNYFQIDFLKAIMIFLVIFDHMVYWDIKNEIGVALWERISIPVFLVIMGFNLGHSFRRTGANTLKNLYTREYFKKKIVRYIIPFLLLYLVSTITGFIIYDFNFNTMFDNQYYPHWGIMHLFIGILPFWGPGNWFIPVILQTILLAPLVYYGFTRKPKLTLILCFLIEIGLHLSLNFFLVGTTDLFLLQISGVIITSFMFYISGIGLGFWFSQGHDLNKKRNLFMWILLPLSLLYLILYQFFEFRLRIDDIRIVWGDYNFIVIPYSAFLVLLALNYLPKNPQGWFARRISIIGKSTYHILLIQMLALGMMIPFWGTHYVISAGFSLDELIDLVAVWALTIPVGIKWYNIDKIKNLKKRLVYYLILFGSYISVLILLYSAALFASSL